MSRETNQMSQAKDRRAALLREALTRYARTMGRFRGHVLRRITHCVGHLPRPGRLRVLDPVSTLIETMPSVHLKRYVRLGLGLAGGGGGSPGSICGNLERAI